MWGMLSGVMDREIIKKEIMNIKNIIRLIYFKIVIE